MRRLLATMLVLGLGAPAAAQDLAWERVGEARANSSGGEWTDGFLWVDFPLGLHRIPAPYGPAQAWELVYDGTVARDPVYALSPDTLLTYSGVMARSVDGGATFEPVLDGRSESRPVEVPAGPHAGRLVVGDRTGTDGFGYARYSDDRGATWTPVFGPPPDPDLSARYLEAVTRGPRAGRLVAAGFWGIGVSDDGGATWAQRQPWAYAGTHAQGMARLPAGGPDGGERLLVVMAESIGNVVYASDDGGETWAAIGQPPEPYSVVVMVPLGGRSVVAVLVDGGVHESSDGGATWLRRGTVPGATPGAGSPRWASLGPDGRLYVGGSRLSADTESQGFTWRTTTAYAVSTGEASPEETLGGLSVEPNPTTGALRVQLAAPAGPLRVTVLDALGRTVATLHDGAHAGGPLGLGFNGRALAPGVYAVWAESADGASAQTVTVIR